MLLVIKSDELVDELYDENDSVMDENDALREELAVTKVLRENDREHDQARRDSKERHQKV